MLRACWERKRCAPTKWQSLAPDLGRRAQRFWCADQPQQRFSLTNSVLPALAARGADLRNEPLALPAMEEARNRWKRDRRRGRIFRLR